MSSILRLSCLVFALTGLQTVITTAFAETTLWQEYADTSLRTAVDSSPNRVQDFPKHFRAMRLNEDMMRQRLAQAPMEERSIYAQTQQRISRLPLDLDVPLPEGDNVTLRFENSPIMAQALADQYPDINTYRVYALDSPNIQGRADFTPQGFHIMLTFADGRTVFIDPREEYGERFYISYYKHDYQPTEENQARCLVEDHAQHKSFSPLYSAPTQSTLTQTRQTASRAGTDLRHYRLALAATAEYTAFHGGTIDQAMSAMTTTMNRVNQVFERDLSIRLDFVPNNNLLIYTNASTDPYTNNDGERMLGENQANIDQVIGNSNYDIGHVFSTGGGGIALLASLCNPGRKAGGVTGFPRPENDVFAIDFVSHEMGHQFAATHTFNHCSARQQAQRTSSTAFEPGGGSTVMSYAGICTSRYDLQANSDAVFHVGSISQILNFVERRPGSFSIGGACYTETPISGNSIPQVSAGDDYTIPARTPFTLTASASDANGDSLTYAWEQFDAGTASEINEDLGDNALFRSFMPSESPSRTFPRLEALLGNSSSLGETLPSTTRNMTFFVTVRDNRGAVEADKTTLRAIDTGSAFQVTSPNNSFSTAQGQQLAVQWDVAGTNGSEIACSAVNIDLSRDGGQNFGATLAHKTPNDGNEVVYLPYGFDASNQGRLRVSCADNIFFDISNQNFTFNTRSGLNNLPVTTSTGSSRARISAYVFNASDASKSAGGSFSRNQPIHITMELSPDASDIGHKADIYIVANYNNQWYMKSSSGNWEIWRIENGLAALIPAQSRRLKALESIDVQLNVSNLPGNFLTYVGYRNTAGAVVYNSQALSFTVN